MQVRRRVLVSGRVQGVFYRDSCREMAQRAGVHGWVHNLIDGRVEAVFEGTEPAVERLLAWCREGPSRAVVTDVAIQAEEPVGEAGFRIR